MNSECIVTGLLSFPFLLNPQIVLYNRNPILSTQYKM